MRNTSFVRRIRSPRSFKAFLKAIQLIVVGPGLNLDPRSGWLLNPCCFCSAVSGQDPAQHLPCVLFKPEGDGKLGKKTECCNGGGSKGVRKIAVGRERQMGRQDSEGSGPHRTSQVGS